MAQRCAASPYIMVSSDLLFSMRLCRLRWHLPVGRCNAVLGAEAIFLGLPPYVTPFLGGAGAVTSFMKLVGATLLDQEMDREVHCFILRVL